LTTRNKVWAAFKAAIFAGIALLCLPQVWVRLELVEPGLPVVEEPLTGSAIAQIGSPALLVVLAAALALLAVRGVFVYLIALLWLTAGGASAYAGLTFLLDPNQSALVVSDSKSSSGAELVVATVSYLPAVTYTVACVVVMVIGAWLALVARRPVNEGRKSSKYERDSYQAGDTDHAAIWDAQDAGLDLTDGKSKP
jgi:uncharacterized membrane protein (TIGR02234 family)